MGAPQWEECAGSFPDLPADEVHVWRSSISEHVEGLARLRELLNPEEAQRAARLRFDRDRDRFTVARALLRLLIARYQGVPPGDVSFGYSEHGKPALAAGGAGPALQFNVSHSGDLALFAFARERRVGVDVEALKPAVAREPISERFFTAAETAMLRALPPQQQPEAFFDCWVRKEAAIKAWGTGLSLPLDSFEVLPAAQSGHLECPEAAGGLPRHWSIRALHPGEGYKAALVVEGLGCAVRRLRRPGGALP